jgi:threonine 3-dehydrogenase
MLTPGGRVSLLGILDKPMELNLNTAMIFRSATVFGITGRRMFETWYQVKGLLAKPSFKEKISAVITHRIPIRDIGKGMDLIESKQAAKIALEPKW